MRWIIRNRLENKVCLTWFALKGITVRPASDALQQEIVHRCAELLARYPDPAGALQAFAPARAIYHACGLDPSKVRPSSEALIRRILQGKGLYRVNTAVDAANLASISIIRPIGLYDAGLIQPVDASEANGRPDVAVVTLLEGSAADAYPGIGKEMIHLEGRPALFDRAGPFGNPSSDSARTKVTEATTQLLFVVFEPVGEPEDAWKKRLNQALSIMQRHVGGTVEDS